MFTKVKETQRYLEKIDAIKYTFNEIKEAEQFIDEYQTINNVKFSVYKTELGFKSKGSL